MPVHLKVKLIVELTVTHKYETITVLPFSKYASPNFPQKKPNRKLRLLVDPNETVWLKMIKPKLLTQSAFCQMQRNKWLGSLSSACLNGLNWVNVCRWRTNDQWNCLHYHLSAELLPEKYLSKVSADLCLRFQDSCASTWTQLLKLSNVLKTWTMMRLQPTLLRIQTRTFDKSSSPSAKQEWNWL